VEKVLAFIQSDDRLKGLRRIESPVSPEEEAIHHGNHGHSASSPLAAGEDAPFRWDHVRVKLKKEVTFYNCQKTELLCYILNVEINLRTNNLIRLSFLFSQIVTLGMPTVSPIERVGKYIGPKEWNSLISDPDTVSYIPIIGVFFIFIMKICCCPPHLVG
jgi:hypothetical protein